MRWSPQALSEPDLRQAMVDRLEYLDRLRPLRARAMAGTARRRRKAYLEGFSLLDPVPEGARSHLAWAVPALPRGTLAGLWDLNLMFLTGHPDTDGLNLADEVRSVITTRRQRMWLGAARRSVRLDPQELALRLTLSGWKLRGARITSTPTALRLRSAELDIEVTPDSVSDPLNGTTQLRGWVGDFPDLQRTLRVPPWSGADVGAGLLFSEHGIEDDEVKRLYCAMHAMPGDSATECLLHALRIDAPRTRPKPVERPSDAGEEDQPRRVYDPSLEGVPSLAPSTLMASGVVEVNMLSLYKYAVHDTARMSSREFHRTFGPTKVEDVPVIRRTRERTRNRWIRLLHV